jgi:pimeloyl-ACP methyl ester carboxylesterase
VEYRDNRIDVHGVTVQVLQGGSGPDLLYLHSAGGEVAWLPFFDLLAQSFTVHVPAHPGFAGTEGLEKIDTIHDLVFHTVDVLDTLGLQRPHVAGLSLGAWLAAELAVHQRERVARLVLFDPVGIPTDGGPPYADFFAASPVQLRHLVFADGESEIARTYMPDEPTPEALMEALKAMQATARVAWDPFAHDPKLGDRLYRVQAPTTIIWGEQDRLADVAHARRWHAAIAGSQLVTLAHCGHAPPFESPQEAAELVRRALLEPVGSATTPSR